MLSVIAKRALGLVALTALLAGCGHDLGEDAALAPAGTGIPVGAPNATGASYDPPAIAAGVPDPTVKPPTHGMPKLPHPMPPDPFGGDPTGPLPKKKNPGVNL